MVPYPAAVEAQVAQVAEVVEVVQVVEVVEVAQVEVEVEVEVEQGAQNTHNRCRRGASVRVRASPRGWR
jgi:hypothetical protein